ncbi:MAG: hypothetical protein ACREVL_06775 [Solimonas sp.]
MHPVKDLCLAIALSPLLFCAACASHYLTPGAAAPLAEIAGASSAITQPPSPQFPVAIGIVQVQAAGYRSWSASALGSGRYGVLAATPATVKSAEAIAHWPLIEKAAPIDAALLPAEFGSFDDLRLAAAKSQADILLVYTLDTAFHAGARVLAPASDLRLGQAPDGEAYVGAAADARFVDVRTGYVYASAQGAARMPAPAPTWASAQTLDQARQLAEQQAYAALLQDAEARWRGVAAQYR